MTFKSKRNNKFIYFKKIDKIFRVRETLSRYKKIRLDKNERPTDFESYFINKIKKKINFTFWSIPVFC